MQNICIFGKGENHRSSASHAAKLYGSMPAMDAALHKRQVGDRLRLIIEALGITQVEAAGVMGISAPRLGNWLRGDNYPSNMAMLKLKARYGVTLDYLISDSVVGLPKALADDLRAVVEASSEA